MTSRDPRYPHTPMATFPGESLTFVPESASAMQTPPPVLLWARIFAGLMAAMYLLCVLMGPLVMLAPDAADMPGEEAVIMGVVFMVIGFPLFALYAVSTVMPRRPWMYVTGIVAIAIGMTSACCLPLSIPLLIYWLKPDVKTWFYDNYP